eukprot:m.64112 g.64112  ORF g.64112 m.64112 type:complete len:133 (-) comp11624_c0_seq1:1548-1946(-)
MNTPTQASNVSSVMPSMRMLGLLRRIYTQSRDMPADVQRMYEDIDDSPLDSLDDPQAFDYEGYEYEELSQAANEVSGETSYDNIRPVFVYEGLQDENTNTVPSKRISYNMNRLNHMHRIENLGASADYETPL